MVSGLGFGCAPMMGRVGKTQSLRALGLAFDEGINFFDVARSYGYGEAEGVLGQFLKGKRDRAIIATKVGIRASPQSWVKKMARMLARPATSMSRGLLKLVRSQAKHQFQGGVFTPAEMVESLETSLRELQTDHVDVLYLHDIAAEALSENAVLETCRQYVREGKVRYLGLATHKEETELILKAHPGFFDVASITCNAGDPVISGLCRTGVGLVGRQPFGGHGGFHELVAKCPGFIKVPPNDAAAVAMAWALHHSGVDSVISSFFNERHVKQNLQILHDPDCHRELCAALTPHLPLF